MSAPSPHYVRHPSPTWFLDKRTYLVFILRELSSLFGAGVVLLQLFLVYSIGQGAEATASALALFGNPAVIAFHVVAAGFVGLHVATWFQLNAHIMEIRTGETTVPRSAVITAEAVAFAAITAALLFVLVR